MYAVWSKLDARKDERGFTLTELLATIAILAILIAVAVIVFLYYTLTSAGRLHVQFSAPRWARSQKAN